MARVDSYYGKQDECVIVMVRKLFGSQREYIALMKSSRVLHAEGKVSIYHGESDSIIYGNWQRLWGFDKKALRDSYMTRTVWMRNMAQEHYQPTALTPSNR